MSARTRYWAWASFVYAALMGPIAVVIVVIAQRGHHDQTWLQLTKLAGYILLWPLWVAFSVVTIWYIGAFGYFVFWKYAELIQFLTGLRFGSWVGQVMANDRFLKNAPPSGPYGWVYRKVTKVYAAAQDGANNVG